MEFTRVLKTVKEARDFKKKYSSGEIETNVIMNLLQPAKSKISNDIKEYCDFWYNNDLHVGILDCITIAYALEALKNKFGKHDFKFEGNREYTNYVLEYDGITVISSGRLEYVIPEEKENLEFIKKIVGLNNAYKQFIFDYVMSIYESLPDFFKKDIIILNKSGVIKDGKINYNILHDLH